MDTDFIYLWLEEYKETPVEMGEKCLFHSVEDRKDLYNYLHEHCNCNRHKIQRREEIDIKFIGVGEKKLLWNDVTYKYFYVITLGGYSCVSKDFKKIKCRKCRGRCMVKCEHEYWCPYSRITDIKPAK